MNTSSPLAAIVSGLPAEPGIYQFLNEEGAVIYVGKAKSLKSRVSSYFRNQKDVSPKVGVMVRKIKDIRYMVVDNESDALLLENNLIKKYQPRYNILLKDDKSYPWICIPDEPFPRVFSIRNIRQDRGRYFGPYASVTTMKAVLDLIRHLFPLRTCTLNLEKERIDAGKYKVCLEYHLGNCKAPCVGFQEEGDYMKNIEQIVEILGGNFTRVLSYLKDEMKAHAAGYRFEQAEQIKKKMMLLDHYQSKSMVVNRAVSQVDVFSYAEDVQSAFVNFLRVVSGAIVQTYSVQVVRRLDETREDLLSFAILDLRQRFRSHSSRILVPFELTDKIPGAIVTVPKRGDMKKLLELSERNVLLFRADKQKQAAVVDPERHSERILRTLQQDLKLSAPPRHIECFDNSNLQGTHPVSSCVVFRDARPSRKEYRLYNVRTVEGPGDFATMEEVIYRRYRDVQEHDAGLPDLIVVDGGKPQLTAAMNSLTLLGHQGKVPVVGIAKRLEEIYFPGDPVPLYLDKRSESLKVIQFLRDEAHRFGLQHHRNRRSKDMIQTELHGIPGIGPKTAELLLQSLGSLTRVREATREDLVAVVGPSKADRIISYFLADRSGIP